MCGRRKMFGHHDFLGLGALSSVEEVSPSSSLLAHLADRMYPQADLQQAERSPKHETSFIILSDLHLDNYKILTALESVFSAYESMDDHAKPSLFVLCGNFRSRPFLYDGEATREYTGSSHSLSFHPHLTPFDRSIQTPLSPTTKVPLPSLTLSFPPHPRPQRPLVLRPPPSTSPPRAHGQISVGQNPQYCLWVQPV
jgi:DNA polymerase epsilon subunit 2